MNGFAIKVTLALLAATACQSALAQAMYRMKDLGSLGGYRSQGIALNASGQATGNVVPSCTAPCSTTTHAFFWANNGTPMQNIGSPASDEYSVAVGINNSGQVAGIFDIGYSPHAFIWANNGTPLLDLGTLGGSYSATASINDAGEVTGQADTLSGPSHAFIWRNDGRPMQDLGTLRGTESSTGAAINSSGQVTGLTTFSDNTYHAFLWRNNGTPMRDLGTLSGGPNSKGVAINDLGQVTGVSYLANGQQRAFLWRNDGTPMQDLGDVLDYGSLGLAINNSGQVAGDFCTKKCFTHHAFLWRNDGTRMVFLGTLGGQSSRTYSMNKSGQVTGDSTLPGEAARHAFLWRNDGTKMQDLNALIDPKDPLKPYVTLYQGDAINDSSQILADGTDSRTGETHAYFLLGTLLTLSPRSLAFGNVPAHAASASQSVTVTNTSSNPGAIASIKLAGKGAGQFVQTNNCGSPLAGKARCAINVKFRPTSAGAKSATLSVNGGGGGLRSVALTGTGT